MTGPNGLRKAMTKTVIEAALEEEVADHLGHDKHAVEGRNRANSRNGTRSRTVLSDSCGEVSIDVPRDRDGTFEPQLVRKRQRRLGEVNEVVLSLYAKGLTTGEISAHFACPVEVGAESHRVWCSTDAEPPARSSPNSLDPGASHHGEHAEQVQLPTRSRQPLTEVTTTEEHLVTRLRIPGAPSSCSAPTGCSRSPGTTRR